MLNKLLIFSNKQMYTKQTDKTILMLSLPRVIFNSKMSMNQKKTQMKSLQA